MCSTISAQSIFTSTGAGGDWTSAASWSENNQGNPNDADGIPDGNDNVIISGGLTININTATGQNVEDLTISTGTLTFLVAGDLDVEGTLTMTGVSNIIASGVEGRVDHQGAIMTISSGATATIGAIRFDSNGTLNIDGSLAFSSETGAKIFTDINLASSGTWDNSSVPEDFLIDGDIDVASGGTWSGCSNSTDCTYTMRATMSTISGDGTFAVPDITVSAGDQCTNLGNIVLTDNLSGATGTFINGATGTLTLTENGSYSVGTLTLNTVGNTVIYDGTTADVILPGPFYDLQLNMDVGTTLIQVNGASVTVDNDLTITSGRMRVTTAHTLTVGGNVDIQANGELEPNIAGSIVNVSGNVTMTDGLYDQNNGTVNVTGDFTVNSGTMTLNNSASILDVNGTYTVAGGTNDLSSGTFTPEGITINAGQVALFGGITLTAGGTTLINGTMTIDGGTGDKNFNNLSLDGVGTITFTVNETLTVGGDLTMSGTSTIPGGGSNRIVNVTGAFNVPSGTATISTTTLDVDGLTTISGNLAITSGTGTKTLDDLTVNSAGNINFTANETLTVGGNLTMLGTSSITGSNNNHIVDVAGTFNVTSGTGTIGGVRFTVAGGTTLDGTLSFTSATGVKTFGNVVVGASGTWDNSTVTEVFTFTGDLTNNGGTWNGCSNTTGCAYTMTASPSGSINGTGTINVTDFVINAGTIITNNGNVVMTDNITGTGAFINGASGTLTLSENGTYSISTLTLNTVGNTVIYDGTVTDVLLPGPFYDLQVNMDVGTTIIQVNGGDVAVDNDLTVTSGRFRIQTANTLTVGGNVVVEANGEFEPNVAGAVANITGNVTVTDGLYDQNNATVNVTGNFTVNSGTLTFDNAASILDVDGTYTAAGGTNDFSGGTFTPSVLTVDASQSINIGSINLTVTGATTVNGTMTMDGGTGDKNVASVTLANSGNINFTSNETLAISGALSMSGTSSITGTSNNHIVNPATLNVTSGTGTIGGVQLNVSGTTTIDGTLAFSSVTGNKTIGDVVVGATGTFDNSAVAEIFTFTGDLTNNGGTWNGCSNTTGCAYTMTASPTGTISGSGVINVTDFVINTGTAITNNGNVVMTDNITGTGAFINGATGTLTLSENGTYSISTLTLNTVGNTVIYDGTASDVILPGPFYDLQANMDDPTTIIQMNGGDVAVNNNLTVASGRFRLQTANTLTVGGDVIIETNGEFEPNVSGTVANITGNVNMTGGLYDQNQGTVNVGGNFTNSGGALTFDTGTSILDITGNYITSGGTTSNDFNTGTLDFVDMTISTGAATTVASPTITSTGTITVDNGSMTIDGAAGTYTFNNVAVNANGTWTTTAAYDPIINGNLANSGTFTGCNSATGCDYTLASATGTITGSGIMASMSDFILNDGASYTNTNTGGVAITDRIATTSGAGTFINGTNGVMSYGGTTGNFSVTNFTASASPNTVTYNRATNNQVIEPTTDLMYHNLTIDKAGGFDATTNAVLTINGTLTMTSGDLQMGGQNLIMADGATISGGSATSYIQDNGAGTLRQLYTGAGATLSFPMGDTDDYSPITSFTISSATFGASPFLDFSITDANHPSRDVDNTAAGGDDDGTAAVAFISRYWTVSPSDITDPRYNTSYTYVDADVTGTEANMVGVVYRTPAGEAFMDWRVQGTVNATNNTVTITNMDAFGDLYAMDNTTDRLPIVLISFDAKTTESTVELGWVTASEENNDFFTIERSIDGRSFFPVLTIAGADNSDSLLYYNATDPNPFYGRSYYRLKQTDFNGQFDYSEIRSVLFTGIDENLDFKIYPNPISSSDVLIISVPSQFSVDGLAWSFLDSSGRSVHVVCQVEDNELHVDPSLLSKGIYLVKVTDGIQAVTKKLIVR